MTGVIGMLAGGGDLPVDLAERLAAEGRPYFVIRFAGFADPRLDAHPGETIPIARFGAIVRSLKAAGVDRIFTIGKVARPRLTPSQIDWPGVKAIASMMLGAWWGDDSVQRAAARIYLDQGFQPASVAALWPDLLMPAGQVTAAVPDEAAWRDIRAATAAALEIGRRDRGQGAIGRDGRVIAIEDRRHTDAMLASVARDGGQGGVLVKVAKPQQDLRLDPPVIGPHTVRNAAAAHLCGIAVEAGAALLVQRAATVAAAEAAGLFIYGLSPAEMAP